MAIQTGTLPKELHDAMVDWQRRNFKEYDFFIENWSKFYRQEPFRLISKYGELRDPVIRIGKLSGRDRFTKVKDMPDEHVLHAAKIIKAQCSTELGSIQQHRESVHKTRDERTQFDVLRVMAEEFRHAYQMLAVLADDDWGKAGRNIAVETTEQLLSMHTGTHVLDAFNVYFDSFVDNVTFCAIIDRVGKYQLKMQEVFAYAPMAQSMGPMLSEEAFHMATGVNPMKRWAAEAVTGEGNVSIGTLQRHINKWFPRGMEMFGDERGGQTNIDFGFKDMVNSDAIGKYAAEIKTAVVDVVNAAAVRARLPSLDPEGAVKLADEIASRGEPRQGVRPEDVFYMPSEKFYRRRGLHAFKMVDVHGHELKTVESYLAHLRTVLPESYLTTPDFTDYVANLKQALAGADVQEGPLPFYG